MSNGKGAPDCHICDFYVPGDEVNRCGKHNFLVPNFDHEKLCLDWEYREYKVRKPFPRLKPGILYYYSYASPQVLEPLYTFDQLDRPITLLSVPVGEDSEYGWVLYPHKDQYPYFPEPGGSLSVKLDDSYMTFSSIDAKRMIVHGWSMTEKGEKKFQWNMGDRRIIHCPSSPPGLYLWLDRFFDVGAYFSRYRQAVSLFPQMYILVQFR